MRDFIDKKSFPELVVVADVLVVFFTYHFGLEMFTLDEFLVFLQVSQLIQDLSFDLCYLVVKLCLLLVGKFCCTFAHFAPVSSFFCYIKIEYYSILFNSMLAVYIKAKGISAVNHLMYELNFYIKVTQSIKQMSQVLSYFNSGQQKQLRNLTNQSIPRRHCHPTRPQSPLSLGPRKSQA
jgi:hypothetical protein